MKTILFDVDTQKDFMNEDGALYVPGAEDIKNEIAFEIIGALQVGMQIVGSLDIHNTSDPEMIENGGPFPQHCIKDTNGVSKTKGTPNIYEMINPGDYDKIDDAVEKKTPMYFSKTTYDVFENPELEKFLKAYYVDEAIVIGVATDYCVRAAVLGMQKRGIHCMVLTKAIAGVDPKTTKEALKEMVDAGAELI